VEVASSLVSAYLGRLGLEAEPPSVDALFRIHRAQVDKVAYESLWIQMGERWPIDAGSSLARIATQRRGGYCFHLNGALGRLLVELGYSVRRHVGGVHGPNGPSEAEMTNHLVLTVAGLPTDANPGGTWYVDAGLGYLLYEPLPLVSGSYRQGPFRLALEQTPGDVGDWHLVNIGGDAFGGMAWRSADAAPGAFDARHRLLSTSPDSPFVKLLTVQRRDEAGADVLRGLVLLRLGEGAGERVITLPSELFDALADLFGVGPIAAPARSRLWGRVSAAHEAWEAAGRPNPSTGYGS